MTFSLLLLLADAAAPAAGASGTSFIVPFVAIGVIFYFLIIRPQNQRQKELATLVSNLKTGDKVVTSGGIHGVISNVRDGSTLILKIDDNCKIEVDKTAIATVDRGTAVTPKR
jgi:preprotein translocase subunit YajC